MVSLDMLRNFVACVKSGLWKNRKFCKMSTTELTAPVKDPRTPQEWFAVLTQDKTIANIGAQIAGNVNPDHLARVVYGAMTRSPKLFQCTKASVMFCLAECARLGLEPALGRVYFIPFNNKKTGAMDCTMIIGYQGLCELARRSGEVLSIEAVAVRKGDEFQIVRGTESKIHHVPKITESGEQAGESYYYYCVAKFRDGGYHVETMSRAEVDTIRERSLSKDSGPWKTDYDEMAKKTVIRRAAKMWPMSVNEKMTDALQHNDEGEFGDVFDVSSEQPMSMAEKAKARMQPKSDAPLDADMFDEPDGEPRT